MGKSKKLSPIEFQVEHIRNEMLAMAKVFNIPEQNPEWESINDALDNVIVEGSRLQIDINDKSSEIEKLESEVMELEDNQASDMSIEDFDGIEKMEGNDTIYYYTENLMDRQIMEAFSDRLKTGRLLDILEDLQKKGLYCG